MSSLQVIPASSDTLFIRGFSTRHHVDEIRNFFAHEAGRSTVEFVKESGDGETYLLALKFESKNVAREILNRFDGVEVLGDLITIVWYKDIRKSAGYGYDRGGYRRGGWSADRSYDYRGGFRGGRSNVPYYGPLRGNNFYSGPRGVSSEYIGRPRRRLPPSRSRSKSASRSRSRSRSSSCSDDLPRDRPHKHHRRSTSTNTKRRSRPAKCKSSGGTAAAASVKSESHNSDSAAERSGASSDVEVVHRKKKKKKSSKHERTLRSESRSKETVAAAAGDSAGADVDESKSPTAGATVAMQHASDSMDSPVTSRIVLRSTVSSIGTTSRKVIAVRSAVEHQNGVEPAGHAAAAAAECSGDNASPLSDSVGVSVAKATMMATPDKKRTVLRDDVESMNDAAAEDSDGADASAELPGSKYLHRSKDVLSCDISSSDYGGGGGNVVKRTAASSRDFGALGLPPEKMVLVREKKDDIEKSYRQDCETFATVTKMLINKDPGIEDRIQFSLRENLKDIGKRCIHELRSFIDGLRAEDEDEDCF